MSEPRALTDRMEGRGAASGPDDAADRLWPEALRLASGWCAGRLRRLRRGEGGIYEAEDLLQDLYVEYRAVAAQCRDREGGEGRLDEARLWPAWSRRLWHGGQALLYKRKQAPWGWPEEALDPQRLAEDADEPTPAAWAIDADDGTLGMAADAASVAEELAALDRLEAALWALPPFCRQALYLSALRCRPARDIALSLGLADAHEAYVLVRRAKRRLRRALAEPDAAPEGGRPCTPA